VRSTPGSSFRVFGLAASRRRVTTSVASSHRIGYSLRVLHPSQYRPHCLSDPTSPLGLPSAVWFSRDGGDRATFQFPEPHPLAEFRLRTESRTTSPSRPAAANQLLSWTSAPFSTCSVAGPHSRAVPGPLRSDLRVWLPSRRFTPCDALPALFRAGSAPGIGPSKRSRPQGTRAFPPVVNPPAVSPAVSTAACATGRPCGPRLLGFNPCGRAWRPTLV
jgi:hypothetical protein